VLNSWYIDVFLLLLVLSAIIFLIRRSIRASAETQRWLREKVKEKTAELEMEMERAENSEKAKEQFLANMSHEIRTPLNAILGMTRLLLEKNPREDQLRYLNAISESSDNLLVIINDILDLSKIEAGKILFEKIVFSPKERTETVVNTLLFQAMAKGLELDFQTDPDVPERVEGDPYRLNQVLINLVGNAIKFTDQGKVLIHTQLESQDDKAIQLKFSVSDTGIGISKDKLQHIFNMFTQESSSTTRKFGGTGLGLAICKRLIELQGGRIEVESEMNKGSVFSFVIPYQHATTAPTDTDHKTHSDVKASLSNLRILLAEDNEFNKMVAVDTLEEMIPGAVIDVAVNGKAAVELAIRNTYDIILMDIQMPEMDGYEATKLIRSYNDEKINSIPIIAMTASVIKAEVDKCFECGMNAFVGKPFNPEELMETISKNINH
jgi:signal transduction histidine kinase